MSSYFRTVGKLKDSRGLLKAIMDRINRIEQQVNALETIDFRHFVRSNNDRILYVGNATTEIGTIFLDPNLKNYQMPMEPDGDKLKMWFKFLQFQGQTAVDSSGFDNNGTFEGSPETSAGPINSLPAVLFDGNDRLTVPHNADELGLITQAVGFTFSFNFNPLDISEHNGMPRILACKTDDDPAIRHQGWVLWVEPNGSLNFSVVIANIKFTATFTTAFPALNEWYRVVCTFDRPTVTPKIYINGVVSTGVTSQYFGNAQLPSASLDLNIGGYDDPNMLKGMSDGLFSDVRFWREKVLTQAEIDNLMLNGMTISNIPKWVARAGVGNFPSFDPFGGGLPPNPELPILDPRSFTEASFTLISFTPGLGGEVEGGGNFALGETNYAAGDGNYPQLEGGSGNFELGNTNYAPGDGNYPNVMGGGGNFSLGDTNFAPGPGNYPQVGDNTGGGSFSLGDGNFEGGEGNYIE